MFGVALLVWFLALLAMNEALENAGLLVLAVALIPAVAAAMIAAGILMRLSNQGTTVRGQTLLRFGRS